MPVHVQEIPATDSRRFYFWCTCGVCGRFRLTKWTALADNREHLRVCTGGSR